MVPLLIAAVVGVGLFGAGTAIKPSQPKIGTTLQVAGVGTVVGGGIGAAAGAGSGLATALGTTTAGATVGTTAAVGTGVGAATGWFVLPDFSK